MMKTRYILFVLLVSLLTSCSNDSTDDLTNITVGTITYSEHVQSIISNNCIVCHGSVPSNGAPMSLHTYEDVKNAILNRNLIGKISLENGNSGLMPLGGPRLPQTTIDQIIQWQTDGFQQ